MDDRPRVDSGFYRGVLWAIAAELAVACLILLIVKVCF